MGLSKKSIETLVDLIEIKLSCMEVYDREDARDLATLEKARRELVALAEDTLAKSPKCAKKASGDVIAFPAASAEGKRKAAAN